MDNYSSDGPREGGNELRVVRSESQDEPRPGDRRMERRIVAIRLPGDYSIMSVTAWVNFPNSLLDKMRKLARDARKRSVENRQKMEDDPDWLGDDEDEDDSQAGIAALLSQVIVSHDFVDFDGHAYPPADDMDFYKQAPNDLLLVAMKAIMEQVGKLPTRKNGR